MIWDIFMIIHFHQNFEICKNEKSSKKTYTDFENRGGNWKWIFSCRNVQSTFKKYVISKYRLFLKLIFDDPLPSRDIFHEICLWKRYAVMVVFCKMTKFSISSTFLSWNIAKIIQNFSLVEGAEQRSFLITWCI